MESIKKVPSRIYWFISGIIELFLIFFLSIFKLNKPSDSVNRDDIDAIRRGSRPRDAGNDFRYRGTRGSTYVPMGG